MEHPRKILQSSLNAEEGAMDIDSDDDPPFFRAVQATVNKEPCGKQVFEARVATLTDEILVEVSGTEAVRALKEKVANKMGWASHRETQLLLDGVHLHNDMQSLFEYGLTDDNRSFQAIRVEAYTEAMDSLEREHPSKVVRVFRGLPANAQRDEYVVETAWQKCADGTGRHLYWAMPEEWKKNAEIVDKAFGKCAENYIPELYAALPPTFRENKNIVTLALEKCYGGQRPDGQFPLGKLFQALPSEFQKEEHVVKKAWERLGDGFGYHLYKAMPDEWRKDEDVIRKAFEKCDAVRLEVLREAVKTGIFSNRIRRME